MKAAVRWARAHAEEYGLDPDCFGMLGDSAGGHLPHITSFTANHPEFVEFGDENVSDCVQAIVSTFGVTLVDTEEMDKSFAESGITKRVFGVPSVDLHSDVFGSNRYLHRVTSPVYYVSGSIPPVLFLHGMADAIFPYQQSLSLHEKIENICGEGRSELVLYESHTQEDIMFNGKDGIPSDLCGTAGSFFDKYLK